MYHGSGRFILYWLISFDLVGNLSRFGKLTIGFDAVVDLVASDWMEAASI